MLSFAKCSKEHKELTLYGKIVIIKTFLMSQIIYKVTVLPANIINDIVNVIMNFLWSGKQPRIKREVLYNSHDNGGIKLPHLPTQITAINVSR